MLVEEERTCEGLVALLGMARRSGGISRPAVSGDAAAAEPLACESPAAFRRARLPAAEGYRLDHQAGQRAGLEVWCDTGGMVPQLAAVADPWDVPVYAGTGLSARRAATGGHGAARIMVIGDGDPGGAHLFSATAEDVTAFAAADAPDAAPRFDRLAVTGEQTERYDLPAAPVKAGDRRSFPGTATTRAEALPPDAPAALGRESIARHRDTGVLAGVREREGAQRRRLLDELPDRPP
ncbi:hypothetical protein NX801_13895 [Streptomyces sp. LP05-1]|uniref:Uncharacterized protein n=1 Tax=Streptomyces pyxinae TaxID=2970734 RepID=A0ABT2CH47_9ACTN|nr:hypothetical protein [Streptomyces sp. LP05-1]MCS0636733.1 hypothetical protein [Streptomyces sp. LP05-1]